MPKQVVYIAGLGHSGSTLLDLILGGHSRFVGLGEICSLLSDPARPREPEDYRSMCSCGETIGDCTFWGPLCRRIKQQPDYTFQDRYRLALKTFDDHFGSDTTLVDSSKNLAYLRALRELLNADLRVLFLIRDVRPWSVSVRAVRVRKEGRTIRQIVRKHGWGAWRPYLARTGIGLFRQWHKGNRALKSFLVDSGLPFLRFGYEELALYPDEMVGRICEFLHVDPEDAMTQLQHSGSHCAFGNRMHSQKEKRARIMYDNRWFYSGQWLLPSVVLPRVMEFNRREVYGNSRDAVWTR